MANEKLNPMGGVSLNNKPKINGLEGGVIDWNTPAGIYGFHGKPEGSPNPDFLDYGILVVLEAVGIGYKAQIVVDGNNSIYFRLGVGETYRDWTKLANAQ